ncbi:hypothetical protein M1146_06500, partial [Patescibacteria group bacterium]|nr:hypothetical protein [Patescibacteria group bacterium]
IIFIIILSYILLNYYHILIGVQHGGTQQQEGLNQADTNLTAVNDNLDAGVTELEQARDLRRGCCGKFSYLSLTMIIVIVIIISFHSIVINNSKIVLLYSDDVMI